MSTFASASSSAVRAAVARCVASAHVKPAGVRLAYGTAGFRTAAERLPFAMLRMGVLAALRAKAVRAPVGAVVTASHNPEVDNGIKLVDSDGGFLPNEWERYASELVTVDTAEEVADIAVRICATHEIDADAPVTLVIGMDTRGSSPLLVDAVKTGACAFANVQIVDLGLATTPHVHWLVQAGTYNDAASYFEHMAGSFKSCLQALSPASAPSAGRVIVDCANGVGRMAIEAMQPLLAGVLELDARNLHGQVNAECGAEHVQKLQCPPANMGAQDVPAMQACASFDGDADRIVLFYFDRSGTFHLLDGDKIACLLAGFVTKLLGTLGIDGVSCGVVQTAYANGRSTMHLERKLAAHTMCVPTGVKHLHHASQTSFEVAVYFEANGHGTVLFNRGFHERIAAAKPDMTPEQLSALDTLMAFVKVANQAVGDALSDLLMVLCALRGSGWSIEEWDAIYADLPSKQVAVRVAEPLRASIVTTNAERQTTAPEGLQAEIDAAVRAAGDDARAFVRPSGTEPVVRIYAEAATRDATDALAAQIQAVLETRSTLAQA